MKDSQHTIPDPTNATAGSTSSASIIARVLSSTTTFAIVLGSLIDSLVMTFFYITFLPAFLRTWHRLPLVQFGCLVILAMVLLDSGPRILFFSRRCDQDHQTRIWLYLAVTMIALYLEVFCLATLAATGSPACERFLVSSFLVSSLARMMYKFAGGPPISRGAELLFPPTIDEEIF